MKMFFIDEIHGQLLVFAVYHRYNTSTSVTITRTMYLGSLNTLSTNLVGCYVNSALSCKAIHYIQSLLLRFVGILE